ncbi:MAG: hypothetical protein KC561_10470 [Myxococcales bacterium]|nr:hypothetical protein [Myxococcales bacterium]
MSNSTRFATEAKALLEQIDLDAARSIYGKSMLLTSSWSTPQLEAVCQIAKVFELMDRAGVPADLFPNELNYAIFFDNSTRTKSSWAGAAARLGASAVIVDGSSTQVAHGETAEETGAMLGMNSHALGIRHDLILGEGNAFMESAEKGISDYLAATDDPRKVPIVNLQCDIDHPTQSLADLCFLREKFPDGLEGKTITVSWAYSPSYAKPLSVPQGLITLLPRFGANVRLAHPAGYTLLDQCTSQAADFAKASGGSFEVFDDMDAAFEGADVVYPKSWGPYELMLQRVAANRAGDKAGLADLEKQMLANNKNYTSWICDERRMGLTNGGDAIYMHCLPADIGDEVSAGVMDKARVDLAMEANKKVYAIMALLAGAKSGNVVQALADRL